MNKIKVAVTSAGPKTLFALEEALSAVDELLLQNIRTPVRLDDADQIGVLRPDVLVVGVDRMRAPLMKEAMDEARRRVPEMGIVAVLEEADMDVVQSALSAGAKNVLVPPFERAQAAQIVIEAYNAKGGGRGAEGRSTVITVYGTKGGCGKTTLVANLATALQILTERRVVAVDLDLEFGDLAVLLQQERHGHQSLYDLLEDGAVPPDRLLASLARSDSGRVSFIPSLSDPAQLSSVTQEHIKQMLETLRSEFDYVVIDSHQSLDSDRTLEGLDIADVLLVVMTPDVPTLLKTGRAFDTLEKLGYSEEKVKLVANRSNTGSTVYVEEYLGHKVDFCIPSNGMTAVPAANRGVPFAEQARNRPITRAIFEMARAVAREEDIQADRAGGRWRLGRHPRVVRGAPAADSRL